MTFAPENLGLQATGLALLRDLVHDHTGLFYDEGKFEMFGDRLAPLVIERRFRSFLDFYYLLKYDEREAPSEWRKVVDALSVPETYFWREIEQIRGLACRVLPEIVKVRRHEPIRIWSVPCASGEEPLTIAMVLQETGWFDRVPIEIHGSDGSAAAIAKATTGKYRERSFRALPPELREKYFVADNGTFTPVPELQKRITSWSVVNLLDSQMVGLYSACPVIFCRNAFIYFSSQSVKKVVDVFADHMLKPGYLLVGASESLLNVTDRFALEDLDHAFAYVKR